MWVEVEVSGCEGQDHSSSTDAGSTLSSSVPASRGGNDPNSSLQWNAVDPTPINFDQGL